jgi:hypothetical protein
MWKVFKCDIMLLCLHIDASVHIVFLSSPEEICIYFDGGIESNCVLHIYYALTQKEGFSPITQAVCIKEKQHLPELKSFVNETITRCV